jgi:hypothetical protein
MALCTVTGIVYLPTGEPARSRVFVFSPAKKNIAQQDGLTIVPDDVWVKTDRFGELSVTLLDGRYVLASGLEASVVVVPDAPTATLYEIMGGSAVPVPDAAPVIIAAPVISGSAFEGGTLTAMLGSASGNPAPTASRQWLSNGSPVSGATGETFVTTGLSGQSITHRVTWSNGVGSPAVSTSNVISVVAPATYQRIAVIGASQEADLFGLASTTTPSPDASQEMGIPVYSLAVSGVRIDGSPNAGRNQIANALSTWPTPGETLFLIGSIAGNDITAVISGGLSDAEAEGIATEYNSMLDLFGEHLPHVHALQTSFRSYTNHGFSGSELFDNPDVGSANLNDRLTPIFQSRLSQSLYYANGDSMVDWYDLTRNNYATWIRDGIHHTTALLPTIRQTLTSRLRAALDGTPPAAVVPAARPALAVLNATPTATDATVGAAYTSSVGRLFNLWDAPYTVTGLPAWATLSRDALGQFTVAGTPTEVASLSIAVTASVAGVSRTSTISLTVAAAGAGGTAGPLSIINFHNGPSTAVGNNNLNGTSSGVELSLASVLDVDGVATGLTFQITAPQGAAIGSTTDPAIGGGNTGRTNLPAYNGQLLSGQITAGFYYVTATPILPMVLSGAVAGATYEVGMVGSRAVTDARETTLRVQGTPTTWNAAEDPPQERRVTVQADAQGRINMELEATGASTFGYISGLSIRRLQA